MNRVIINAPFGNYAKIPGATNILGTFTREYRGGWAYRLWRMALTLRYYPGIKAWKNKLGLPNPGIGWLERKVGDGEIDIRDKGISISARDTSSWMELIARAARLYPEFIELNISCPNCGDFDSTDYIMVFARAAVQPMLMVVKLPPVNYQIPLSLALSQGLKRFNCCNTLPTGNGGLSGKPLKPLSLACVRDVASRGTLDIIGTGGIDSISDARDYLNAGATHIGLASMLFWPGSKKIAQAIMFDLL